MRVAKDIYLIQVENGSNKSLNLKGPDGRNIVIDNDYNKHSHSARIGKIHALPISVSNKYKNDVKLNEGDTVVFHHFVCQKDHKMPVGENIFRSEVFHLYAKIEDGELISLEDVIFVEPIKEKEQDLFCGAIQVKNIATVYKQQGFIYSLSPSAQELGMMVGDKVYFTSNADYKLPVNGKDLYRMRIRNILAVERNGEFIALKNKIFVKEVVEPNMIGSLINLRENNEKKGIVVECGENQDELKKGDTISFFKNVNGSVNINGEEVSFIDLRHINYIYK